MSSSNCSRSFSSSSSSAIWSRLLISSLTSSSCLLKRAIFRLRLSSSSSLRSPSSSVPSFHIFRWRVDALYDFLLTSSRSEKFTSPASIFAGSNLLRASLIRSLERDIPGVSSSSSISRSEWDWIVVVYSVNIPIRI